MVIWIVLFLAMVLAAGSALLRWGTRWGSTPDERTRAMSGDDYLEGGPPSRVAMTRAISIDAAAEQVWPWIAQLGRGAGWYSVDWLDNGRRVSALHLVSWIPEPVPGDATAIGYVRHIDPGQTLAWWVDGVRFFGSQARLVTCIALYPDGQGTRLISRMSADAAGLTAPIALLAFRFVDSIMAIRQLLGIRDRVEVGEERHAISRASETGLVDQYQLYEVIYAGGESAGLQGKEHAARWRESAIEDGILKAEEQVTTRETN
ncbi:SRPBCC family protein [Gemmatimonadota bacterium]